MKKKNIFKNFYRPFSLRTLSVIKDKKKYTHLRNTLRIVLINSFTAMYYIEFIRCYIRSKQNI